MVSEVSRRKQEILPIFRRNFPFIVRDDASIIEMLSDEESFLIEKRQEIGELMGVSLINRNVILMLCVNTEYRKQGIGSWLLEESEKTILKSGYKKVKVGVGYNYLMPGVPTSKRYAEAEYEGLHEDLNECASDFFEKRGYVHAEAGNIFDMRFPLKDFCKEQYSVGDIIEGITYRFAMPDDKEKVWECTDDALKEFTQWYRDEKLYTGETLPKVMIATCEEEVLGALLVDVADESIGLGTIGCTSVRKKSQGRHIATNMVILATKYLRDAGMKEAYLSYTYSGLERLYGAAGYKICVYFMMAEKNFD